MLRDADLLHALNDLTNAIQLMGPSKGLTVVLLSDLRRLIKFRKSELENEELVKVLLRALVEAGAKRKVRSKAVKRQGSALLSEAAESSKTLCKALRVALKKLDFNSFNNLMDFTGQTANKEVLTGIAERVREEGAKLEAHKRPWNPLLFSALAKGDAAKDFAQQVRDVLRRKPEALSSLAEVFSQLDLTLIEDHQPFEEIFDVSFTDALKNEQLTVALLSFMTPILRGNKALQPKSRSESFISMINSRIAKAENQEVLVALCNLVVGLNFAFDSRVQNEILATFVDNLGAIKSTLEANKIVDLLAKNKSFRLVKLDYLVERKKAIEQPTILYAMSALTEDTAAYTQFLSELYTKTAKQKVTFANYKNYTFYLAHMARTGQLEANLQLDFLTRVTSKDDYYSKPNYFENVLRSEADAVLTVASAISDESLTKADFSHSDKHVYGLFLISALSAYFKTWRKSARKFNKKTLKIVLRSLAILLCGENKPKIKGECFDDILLFILVSNQLRSKNPIIFHKAILLASTSELLNPWDVKLVVRSPLVQEHVNTELPVAFYRLFSRQNLFTEQSHKTWSNLLMHSMFFSPTMLQQSMYFFAKRNLVYLLNMSQLTQDIDAVKPLPLSFFFDRDEWEAVGIKDKAPAAAKGKGKQPPKEDTFDDVQFIAAATDFDADPGQNEDEKFDELKLSHNKAPLLAAYEIVLTRISEVYLHFFSLYPKLFRPAHIEVVERQLHIFKDSFKTVDHFSALLNLLYSCFLRNSSRNSSFEFKQLLEFNSGIIRGNDSPQFVRSLEYFIQKADLSRIHVTRDVYEILFEVLSFVFDNKIDIEYQRKLFSFVYRSLSSYTVMERPFFDFVCKKFDGLNFEEAFEAYVGLLKRLAPEHTDLVDRTLLTILDNEEFVVCFLLKTFKEMAASGVIDNQKVTVLQQLKVLILSEGEEPKTAQPAKELIAASPLFRFGAASFDSLDFKAIIRDFPADLHETIASILTNIYDSLNGSQKHLFMKTLIQQTRELVLETKLEDEDHAKEAELRYQLFPKTMFHLIDRLDEEFVFAIFTYIFGEFNRRGAAQTRQAFR